MLLRGKDYKKSLIAILFLLVNNQKKNDGK